MTKTELHWTRFSVSKGTETTCGSWWIMAPGSKRSYEEKGVQLYRWDAENMDYIPAGRYPTYAAAREAVSQ